MMFCELNKVFDPFQRLFYQITGFVLFIEKLFCVQVVPFCFNGNLFCLNPCCPVSSNMLFFELNEMFSLHKKLFYQITELSISPKTPAKNTINVILKQLSMDDKRRVEKKYVEIICLSRTCYAFSDCDNDGCYH